MSFGNDTKRPTRGAAPEFPLWFLAMLNTVVVAGLYWVWRGDVIKTSLGDTDDALRLVLVRDLLDGRAGWWDQHFMRLQPPLGMDLHWSRLVDGGIALMESGFRLFLNPAAAEFATRVFWPMLWLAPVIAAALHIARRLGGSYAMLLCSALLFVSPTIYAQWTPGRLDHHDVQIALCLVALAGAVAGGRRGGLVAGGATALGLAVGVEALLFDGVIGAAIALRYLFQPDAGRPAAQGYGASLLLALPVLFLVQTPPGRWGVSVCDALGLNLTGGAAVAALGLLAATAVPRLRVPLLLLTGAAAAGLYVALEPACLHGPLGQADPRLGPLWLDRNSEMQPLLRRLSGGQNGFAIGEVLYDLCFAAAWLWLGRRPEGRTFAWGLLGACAAAAFVAQSQALRMGFYSAWFGAPVIAAAVADFGVSRLRRRALAVTLVMAVAASPTWPALAAVAAGSVETAPANASAQPASCEAPAAFARLARLPAGLALGEIDLGPYVLATTPHSVVAAPYHRMSWGILAGDAALAARPDTAEADVRRLGVTYVLDCPAHAQSLRRKAMPADSLQRRLDRQDPPPWLQPLSAPGEPLRVYRVLPSLQPRR